MFMDMDKLTVCTTGKLNGKFHVGEKFGKFTIYDSTIYKSTNEAHIRVECDCGKIFPVRVSNLIKNRHGCRNCTSKNSTKFIPVGKLSSLWTGCGDMSGRYFCNIRFSASKRNLEFDITIEYLWQMFITQQKICALSGLPLQFQTRNRIYDGTASLDRIDSTKGYIEGNVQWVHKDFNVFKRNLSDTEFIKKCTLVANHNKRKKSCKKNITSKSPLQYNLVMGSG